MANALTRMGRAISKRVAKAFTTPTAAKPKTLAQTGKYLAKQYFLQARDLPPFTFETIRVMLQDPAIKLNLAMRAAPIASVEFAYIDGEGPDGKPKYVSGIKARNPVVAAFIKRQLDTIWNSYLPGILVSQNWGWAAGEVTLKLTNSRMIEIDELHPRHAKDCRLLECESTGKRWGVQIKGLADVGQLDIPYPYCYFVNYRPENGEKYSASALIGAYSPWADKWLNGGALDTRRLYMHKDAYGGLKIAYPEEDLYVDGNPNAVPARDIAMQIAEQRQAGGTISYPSTVVDGVPKWRIEDATVSSNPAHILQYPKDLDDEMRHGLEIPDGAINNDGSGAWEGKTLPLAAMYAGLDTWVTQILCDLRNTIDPLVEMNFGPGQEYEICHKPLALQAMEQQSEKRQGGPQEEQPDPFAQLQPNSYRMSLDPVEAVGRGVLDAGELVKAARTAIRMSVAPVVDVETEDEGTERATAIAELLTHLYGDDAERKFDQIFGTAVRMAAKWSAIDHPRGPNGRFIAKNSPEAVASAKDTIRNTLNGRRTADTLKTVTEHLSILSTKQLHELKKEYNVKAGGAKPALIQKIASRIHGTAGSKAEPVAEAASVVQEATQSDKPSEPIPQPPAGIQMPSQTVSNADAKEGDQLGLFGEATKAKAKAPEMKIGEPTTGKQGGLFDTHGNADQMDLFGDAGMDSSMVYKPESSRPETYFKGDRAEHTGGMSDDGQFHEVEIMEGRLKGEKRYVPYGPNGKAEYDAKTYAKAQAEFQEQQAGFSRLRELEATERLKAAGINEDSSQDDITKAIANRKITKEDATKARERLIEKETKRQEEAAEYSNRTNTPAADAGIEKVPSGVKTSLEWAANKIKARHEALKQGDTLDSRFQGGGRYRQEVADKMPIPSDAVAKLSQIMPMMQKNGISAAKVMSYLGLDPKILDEYTDLKKFLE